MKRVERYAQVKALHDEGLLQREIAAATGLARSTVSDLFLDPTGDFARARKAKHHGICVDCGAKTFNGGCRDAPERCRACADVHKTKWTRETIVAVIQRWAAEHGRPPSATDWNSTMARADGRPERGSEYPASATVQYVFGSWNAGIEAAGFAALRRGQRERVAA